MAASTIVPRDRLADAVFGVGATLSGLWAFYSVQPLMVLFASGGGGIGAVSSGLELLMYVLAPAIVLGLSRSVRNRRGMARLLRRAHLSVTAAIVALAGLLGGAMVLGVFAHGVNGPWFGVLVGVFVGGALWLPLQGFFAAGFVSLLIRERWPIS